MTTRWPLTAMCLRCMNQWSQTDREFQDWFERHTRVLRSGDVDAVRPNWERTRRGMWLFADDPT